MDLIGNKKRAAEQVKIEFALAALSAHLGCLHAFILALLGTRPPDVTGSNGAKWSLD
jgi:hypothetical protein